MTFCRLPAPALAALLVAAVPLPRQAPVQLTLIPEANTIRQLDPLFVKVCAENNSRRPIMRAGEFSDQSGSVHFEMRRSGAFERIYTLDSGSAGGITPRSAKFVQPEIPPDDRYTAFELLPGGGYRGISAEPGTFELRATAYLGTERVPSPPVTIRVLPISDSDRKVIAEIAGIHEKGKPEISILTGIQAIGEIDGERFSQLEQKLPDGYLKRTVRRMLAIQALREARTPAAKNRAYGELQKLYVQMDPFARELTDLTLAEVFIRSEPYGEDSALAEVHLNRVQDRSSLRDLLQRILQHRYLTEVGLEK